MTATLACSLALASPSASAAPACGPDVRLTNRRQHLRRNRLGGHVARRSRPHRFQLDGGAALWTERAAPFMFNGDPGGRLDTTTLTNGTHILSVDGYDAAGTKIATASKTVTISNSSPAPPPPSSAVRLDRRRLGHRGGRRHDDGDLDAQRSRRRRRSRRRSPGRRRTAPRPLAATTPLPPGP